MRALRDPKAAEAVAAYDQMHRSLLKDARVAEQLGRPITAGAIRHKASIVARAALAEELDPEPRR